MLTYDEIVNKITDVIDIKEQISPDTKIYELGVDSLDLLMIIYTIEEDLKIELKVSDIEKELTIQDFVNMINFQYNDCNA